MQKEIVIEILKKMAEGNAVSDQIIRAMNTGSLPNIPFPTMGGEVFWNTLAEYGGWKLQQNMITQHARILDDQDVRRAWGSVEGMYKIMERLSNSMTQNKQLSSDSDTDIVEKIKSLKKLLDMGAITQQEYNDKKNQLLSNF